ncbi:MAG: hypothetical protein M1358_21785 [Chloroflexi bacterium]|nr:hypothetical protein [Chloroflexota bacterium]
MDFESFRQLFAPPGTRLFKGGEEREDAEELAELTEDAWLDHLHAGPHLGAFVQRADGRATYSMFDIDIAPRNAPRVEMLRQMEDLKPLALRVRDVLEAKGLSRQQVLAEFSGTGYHLWTFYEEPVPAALIQRLTLRILARVGVDVPFKPRYPFERDKDKVWLPLRVNRNQGVRSTLIGDLEDFDPVRCAIEVHDELLASVKLVDPKKLI